MRKINENIPSRWNDVLNCLWEKLWKGSCKHIITVNHGIFLIYFCYEKLAKILQNLFSSWVKFFNLSLTHACMFFSEMIDDITCLVSSALHVYIFVVSQKEYRNNKQEKYTRIIKRKFSFWQHHVLNRHSQFTACLHEKNWCLA